MIEVIIVVLILIGVFCGHETLVKFIQGIICLAIICAVLAGVGSLLAALFSAAVPIVATALVVLFIAHITK